MGLIDQVLGKKEPSRLRIKELERERDRLSAENSALKTRIELSRSGTDSLRNSYQKRLKDQTQSTGELSETVNSVLKSVKEISSSYEEMLKAVHSLANITRELGISFQSQSETQEKINLRTVEANSASENEVVKAKALKSELGHLESIRVFMANAIDTIDEVSGRLSLLSMNGRIEAAHAGTVGRGFAVVAQEMLQLQQENGKVIASQRSQLEGFLPVMSAMQKESDAVEAQARDQQEIIREISNGSNDLGEQTRINQNKIDELISAVEDLAASIEQGRKTAQIIEEETTKHEFIFKEEVFVSNKMNSMDSFLFGLSKKADTLADAGHLLVNEYQKLSVLNGKSYVWQADSWIVTDAKKLPMGVQEHLSGMGDRVLVCIGQTDNNPTFPQPLSAASGILAVRPIDDITDPTSPLQSLLPLIEQIGLSIGDLKNPENIDFERCHGTMIAIAAFTGSYRKVMQEKIDAGKLICTFGFGGPFQNGDIMLNNFLSDYLRTEKDAMKFRMLGESMVFAFQSIVESGKYWKN